MNYIATKESPELLALRIRLLLAGGAREYALNLVNWCIRHELLARDVTLRRWQLLLLHEKQLSERFLDVCQQLPCCVAKEVTFAMLQEHDEKAAILGAIQAFLIKDWNNSNPSHCCTKVSCPCLADPLTHFAQTFLTIWMVLKKDLERQGSESFIRSVKLMTRFSHSAWHLVTLADTVHSQVGSCS